MSGKLRVLVADDHHAMLDSLVRLLADEFEVVAAVTDGLAAVATAARLEPDLLVLDVAMPGLNGIAAAGRLKARGSTAKVVFVTNLHLREFVQESLALGDVGFVVKDCLVADLIPAIHNVLAGHSFLSPSVRSLVGNVERASTVADALSVNSHVAPAQPAPLLKR